MAQIWMASGMVAMALLYVIWYYLPKAVRQRLGTVHPVLGADQACDSCQNCPGCSNAAKVKTPSDLQPTTQVLRFYPPK